MGAGGKPVETPKGRPQTRSQDFLFGQDILQAGGLNAQEGDHVVEKAVPSFVLRRQGESGPSVTVTEGASRAF